MYVSLISIWVLLNIVGTVYLLARADLTPGKKTGFAAASLGSLALKVFLATRGHNYDMDSSGIVASVVLHGKSFYAHTSRYNYGPLWAFVLAGLQQISTWLRPLGAEAFHVVVAAFLGLADIALAALLTAGYSYGAGIFLLCCPVTILLTGYHSQFENFALLVGLASWMLIRGGSPSSRRLIGAAILQGVSLVTKHILFLFPLWVAIGPQLGSWRKRAAYPLIAYATFAFSFLPWVFDAPSRAGIYQNVFHYRSEVYLSLSRLLVSTQPFAAISPATSSVLTWGWMAALMAAGVWVAWQKGDLFLLYLLVMFALSPALREQYLAIPILACAALYKSWPGWALVGTATLAVVFSPANVFQFPFNLAQYLAMVTTQVCAATLVLMELRCAGPSAVAPLAVGNGVQKAITLAFASLGIIFVIFMVKSWAFHAPGMPQPR